MTEMFRYLLVIDAKSKAAADRLLHQRLKPTDGAYVIDIQDWPEPVLNPEDTEAEVEAMLGKKKP